MYLVVSAPPTNDGCQHEQSVPTVHVRTKSQLSIRCGLHGGRRKVHADRVSRDGALSVQVVRDGRHGGYTRYGALREICGPDSKDETRLENRYAERIKPLTPGCHQCP